jgi:UDP-N-acetyl-D-glucosamine/UDP-N-acetyl-D-galactosamine dehydrogenase
MKKIHKKIEIKKIAIIGLGYVGLPLAVEFSKYRPVIGFDININRINELKRKVDSTLEISTQEMQEARNLEYTSNSIKLSECDIFIITVPTPIDAANRPELSSLIKATEIVGKAIKNSSIVIYESTVYPGCTEEVCVPILEKESGLIYNQSFYCGYSPERINPGDKVNKLITIKKVTSGSTPEIAEIVDSLYKNIIKAGTWKVSSIKVAEASKVIENSQRDLNIAFVNELSVIFNRLGIDTIEVLEASGTKWNFLPFRPGMVGGHCIGVDPYYLTHKAEQMGYIPQVILAGRRINDNMARYVARNIIKLMLKNGIDVSRSTVGVMGVTFKENCPDVRNSKVFDLIKEFKEWNINVVACDPWANIETVKNEYLIDLEQLSEKNQVDSLVVAVAHNEFKIMDPKILKTYCRTKNPVLGDIKAIYDQNLIKKNGFTLFRL